MSYLWLLVALCPLLSGDVAAPRSAAESAPQPHRSPADVAVLPGGRLVLVANHTADTASLVDLVEGKVLAEHPCGRKPVGRGLLADGRRAAVSNHWSGTRHAVGSARRGLPVGRRGDGGSPAARPRLRPRRGEPLRGPRRRRRGGAGRVADAQGGAALAGPDRAAPAGPDPRRPLPGGRRQPLRAGAVLGHARPASSLWERRSATPSTCTAWPSAPTTGSSSPPRSTTATTPSPGATSRTAGRSTAGWPA